SALFERLEDRPDVEVFAERGLDADLDIVEVDEDRDVHSFLMGQMKCFLTAAGVAACFEIGPLCGAERRSLHALRGFERRPYSGPRRAERAERATPSIVAHRWRIING